MRLRCQGKVGVYTGLITLANGNEDEVAAVIGHEVAHVPCATATKDVSGNRIGLGGVIWNRNAETKATLIALARGLGRNDRWLGLPIPAQMRGKLIIGALLFAMAGYDPRAAVSFGKMVKASGAEGSEFCPLTLILEAGLISESHMDHAMDLYRQAKKPEEKPNP